MGEVIRPTASPERIEGSGQAALKNALREGGEIAETAQRRVGVPLERMAAAKTEMNTAGDAVETALEPVLRCDAAADNAIKANRDEVWNTIGRPRESVLMNTLYPGGVGTYTKVDVHDQPTIMQVLVNRLRAAEHPKITAEQRTAWCATIEGVRAPYEAALVPLKAAEAVENVARTAFVDAARVVARGLTRLKRDLKSMDLSETEIHQVIPDAARGSSGATTTVSTETTGVSAPAASDAPEETPPT